MDTLRFQVEPHLADMLAEAGLHMNWDWEQVLRTLDPILTNIAAQRGVAAVQRAGTSPGGGAAHWSALGISTPGSQAACALGAGAPPAGGPLISAGGPTTGAPSATKPAAGGPSARGSATGSSAAAAAVGGPTGFRTTPSTAGSTGATVGASAQMQAEGTDSDAGVVTCSSHCTPKGTTQPMDRWSKQLKDCILYVSDHSQVRADLAAALAVSGAALEQRRQNVRERVASTCSTGSCCDSEQLSWELAACKYAAVAEVKRYAKLFKEAEPLPLVDLWLEAGKNTDPNSEADSAWHIINELFSYMAVTGVQFGWLTCYCATWLAWRPLDDSDSLFLSRPFLHNVAASSATGAVTTMAALSWLQHEACTAWLAGGRHKLSIDLFSPSAPDGDGLSGLEEGGTALDPEDADHKAAPFERRLVMRLSTNAHTVVVIHEEGQLQAWG